MLKHRKTQVNLRPLIVISIFSFFLVHKLRWISFHAYIWAKEWCLSPVMVSFRFIGREWYSWKHEKLFQFSNIYFSFERNPNKSEKWMWSLPESLVINQRNLSLRLLSFNEPLEEILLLLIGMNFDVNVRSYLKRF